RGYAAIASGVAQGGDQRAVAAHGMACNGAFGHGGEMLLDQGGQFLGDVVLHAVVGRPGRLGGVQVEARALAQVVGGIVGHAFAARAGVGGDQDQAAALGVGLGAGLGDEILL